MDFVSVGYPGSVFFTMRKFFLLSFLGLVALGATSPAVAQAPEESTESRIETTTFKIIVHRSNPSDALSRHQISNLLLKKRSRWEDGRQVDPVDLTSRSETRAEMSQTIHERSVASIKNYWQRQIFSGHNTPPPELADDEKVLDFVKANPGSIGYVAADATLDGVKELHILE